MYKFEGTAPPKGRNIVYRIKFSWWVNMRAYNFFVSGPKFIKFLSSSIRDEM